MQFEFGATNMHIAILIPNTWCSYSVQKDWAIATTSLSHWQLKQYILCSWTDHLRQKPVMNHLRQVFL